MTWRVGRSYGIHVYEVGQNSPSGDRPVATFHTAADAARAVAAVNGWPACAVDGWRAECADTMAENIKLRDEIESLRDYAKELIAANGTKADTLKRIRERCNHEVASVWHVSEPFAASILRELDVVPLAVPSVSAAVPPTQPHDTSVHQMFGEWVVRCSCRWSAGGYGSRAYAETAAATHKDAP